jgi:hypothetical protein
MGAKRQKIQLELAFAQEDRGEAPMLSAGGTEAPMARRGAESRAEQERTMEAVCERENLRRALRAPAQCCVASVEDAPA